MEHIWYISEIINIDSLASKNKISASIVSSRKIRNLSCSAWRCLRLTRISNTDRGSSSKAADSLGLIQLDKGIVALRGKGGEVAAL